MVGGIIAVILFFSEETCADSPCKELIEIWLTKTFFDILVNQTERMGEYAPTMMETPSLVVRAHNSLLVNAVRMIFVKIIPAKIMGLV